MAPGSPAFTQLSTAQCCLICVPDIPGFLLLQVFKNLQLFMENKQPEDDLFDRLNVST